MDWISHIRKNLDKQWDWKALSANPNATFEVVSANVDLPWDMTSLTATTPFDTMIANPHMKWDAKILASRLGNTPLSATWTMKTVWPLVCKFNMIITDWDNFSRWANHTEKWRAILTLQHKPWDWKYLSTQSEIDWAVVVELADKPWDWNTLSTNITISWPIIDALPTKLWNYTALSANPMPNYAAECASAKRASVVAATIHDELVVTVSGKASTNVLSGLVTVEN